MGFFSDLAADAKDTLPASTRPAQTAEPISVPSKAQPAPSPGPVSPKAKETPEDTGPQNPAPAKDGHDAQQAQLARLAAMTDQDAAAFSVRRVSEDTERLTRRNMKDCVSEHIQGICRENPDFARKVLHPRKTMVNCFKYIYRKAQEFAKQEMEDLGEKSVNGVYGLDVPDGLCYQWAEAYFNDPDAPEDQEKPKTVPVTTKTAAKKTAEKKSKAAIDGQISLLGEAG